MEEMAARAVAAVDCGELELQPPTQRGTWTDWLDKHRQHDWLVYTYLWSVVDSALL